MNYQIDNQMHCNWLMADRFSDVVDDVLESFFENITS